MRKLCLSPPLALALSLLLPALAAAQPPPEPPPPAPSDAATDVTTAVPSEPPAATDEPSENDKLAAQHLSAARDALAHGEVARACELFARADTLKPSEDNKFELAQCYQRDGKLERAADTFEGIAALSGARSSEAKRRAEVLRQQLAAPPALVPAPAPTRPLQSGGELKPIKPPAAPAAEADDELPFSFGEFMDTRLTWTFGDDDVLHSSGAATPFSPNAGILDRPQYRLFFDSLNSRFAGRENLTHLVLYKKMPGFIDRLDTEASMALRFNIAELAAGRNNVNRAFRDAGSFIRLFYRTGAADDEKTGLGLTLWPLDTDRVRLGYLYNLSWGGTNANINQSIFPGIKGTAPGAKVSFNHELFSVYLGFKTAQIEQYEDNVNAKDGGTDRTNIGQTNNGFMAGGNVHIGEHVTADLGGGYFQQGTFGTTGLLTSPVFTFGLSGRLQVHSKGGANTRSIDLSLYRNDPMKYRRLHRDAKPDNLSTVWSVTLEGTNLWQNLKDFDVAGETRLQPARAAALQGNLKTGHLRMSLTGIYRDLAFVLRNVPSFVPFTTLPNDKDVEVGDEVFVAAAVEYHLEDVHLTPGLGMGLQVPASFRTSSIDAAGETIGRTVVIRDAGNVAILPLNATAVPIFQARASLKWEISTILSAVGWLQFRRDNNGTLVGTDPNDGTTTLRTFVSPDFFGFGTSFQARF